MNIITKSLVLAVTAMSLCAPTGMAQDCDAPFFDTSRPSRFIELGLHIGDGMSSIIQNYASTVPSLKTFSLTPGNKFVVGASVELPFRQYLALGTGFDFAVNNNRWSMTLLTSEQSGQLSDLNTVYTSNRYYTFEIPLYMALRLNLGSHVRWQNELGAYFSLGVGGHATTNAFLATTNALGQNQVNETHYRTKYYKADDGVINTFHDFDWGLHLATGIIVNRHYSVKAVLQVGATDVAKNYGALDINVHNISLAFKAGYIF